MRVKLELLQRNFEDYNLIRERMGLPAIDRERVNSGTGNFELINLISFQNLANLLREVVTFPVPLHSLSAHDRNRAQSGYLTRKDREAYFEELIAKENSLSHISTEFGGGPNFGLRRDMFHFDKTKGEWVLTNLHIALLNFQNYDIRLTPEQDLYNLKEIFAVYSGN